MHALTHPNTPFLSSWSACAKGHYRVVEELLQVPDDAAGINAQCQGLTPLHLACEGGHVRVVEVGPYATCMCAYDKVAALEYLP